MRGASGFRKKDLCADLRSRLGVAEVQSCNDSGLCQAFLRESQILRMPRVASACRLFFAQAIATGIAQMTTAVIASVDHGVVAAPRCKKAGIRLSRNSTAQRKPQECGKFSEQTLYLRCSGD